MSANRRTRGDSSAHYSASWFVVDLRERCYVFGSLVVYYGELAGRPHVELFVNAPSMPTVGKSRPI